MLFVNINAIHKDSQWQGSKKLYRTRCRFVDVIAVRMSLMPLRGQTSGLLWDSCLLSLPRSDAFLSQDATSLHSQTLSSIWKWHNEVRLRPGH